MDHVNTLELQIGLKQKIHAGKHDSGFMLCLDFDCILISSFVQYPTTPLFLWLPSLSSLVPAVSNLLTLLAPVSFVFEPLVSVQSLSSFVYVTWCM